MKALSAVIFDMDGVLINSEPLWRRAMIRGFSEFGMSATEEECRQTMGMRFGEVIALWLDRFSLPQHILPEVERRVIALLVELIESEGEAFPGIAEITAFCDRRSLKKGLATSSSELLMHTVLKKLKLHEWFHAVVSAEKLRYGKPHPEVFLLCAEKIGVQPAECLVIEDSLNGVIAAKAAGMRVIAVPDDEHLRANAQRVKQFSLADHHTANLREALPLMEELIGRGQPFKHGH